MRCTACPRLCGADRDAGERGYCGAGAALEIAKLQLHTGEEPLFGTPAGAVFFSFCPLRCIYCQNQPIVSGRVPGEVYTPERLAEAILALQDRGAANVDLVSPTQYTEAIRLALRLCRPRLRIPVIWNTGGYERVETVRAVAPFVDIFLTDMKYGTSAPAKAYSAAEDYPEVAARALAAMVAAKGAPQYGADGTMRSGVVVRHLVLPGGRRDSLQVLRRIGEAVPVENVVLSLMSQYTPDFAPPEAKTLRRPITTFEYESVREAALSMGFQGYGQEKSSATAAYTPDWNE